MCLPRVLQSWLHNFHPLGLKLLQHSNILAWIPEHPQNWPIFDAPLHRVELCFACLPSLVSLKVWYAHGWVHLDRVVPQIGWSADGRIHRRIQPILVHMLWRVVLRYGLLLTDWILFGVEGRPSLLQDGGSEVKRFDLLQWLGLPQKHRFVDKETFHGVEARRFALVKIFLLAQFGQLIFEEFDRHGLHLFLRLFNLFDEQKVDSISHKAFLSLNAIIQLLCWVVAGLSLKLKLGIHWSCPAAVGKFLIPIQTEVKMLSTRQ